MRTLNDYFLAGGNMSAIESVNNVSAHAVIPDPGRVLSCVMIPHTVIDAEVSFDVLKNDVDTGIDVTLPDETPDESGVEMVMPAPLLVEVGDSLRLRSNGEQTAGCLADLTWVIRR